MLICPKCHHQNKNGAKFCQNCGAPLDHASQKQVAPTPQPMPQAQPVVYQPVMNPQTPEDFISMFGQWWLHTVQHPLKSVDEPLVNPYFGCISLLIQLFCLEFTVFLAGHNPFLSDVGWIMIGHYPAIKSILTNVILIAFIFISLCLIGYLFSCFKSYHSVTFLGFCNRFAAVTNLNLALAFILLLLEFATAFKWMMPTGFIMMDHTIMMDVQLLGYVYLLTKLFHNWYLSFAAYCFCKLLGGILLVCMVM